MKTTPVSSKASEERFAWRCYAIWWFDALALLVIMIAMSARKAFQGHQTDHSEDFVSESSDHDHDLAGLHSAA